MFGWRGGKVTPVRHEGRIESVGCGRLFRRFLDLYAPVPSLSDSYYETHSP